MNDRLTETTIRAPRYIRISRRCSSPSGMYARPAPTALIDSGQRSRSSNTHGVRFRLAAIQVATAQKNCGEVPMMTSKDPSVSALATADGTNDRKLMVRFSTPELAARYVQTR